MNKNYISLCKLLKERGIEGRSDNTLMLENGNYYIFNRTQISDYTYGGEEKIAPAYSISDILRKDTMVKFFTDKVTRQYSCGHFEELKYDKDQWPIDVHHCKEWDEEGGTNGPVPVWQYKRQQLLIG